MLVVGDVMLDRYWFGDVSRISPEAPVPVVHVKRTEERPGGAANVARNITALGGQLHAALGGGRRRGGATRSRGCCRASASTASLHRDPALSTTVKLRVIGHQQQLLRIDFERAPSHEVLAAKLDEYERLVDEADAVVLSDYGKGGLAHVAAHDRARARRHGKPVLVDPKGCGLRALPRRHAAHAQPLASSARWRGAGPTRRTSTRRAQKLRAELDLEALIVTRSEEGMSLFTASESLPRAHRARARSTT